MRMLFALMLILAACAPANRQPGSQVASSPLATPAREDVNSDGAVDVRDVATVAAAAVGALPIDTLTPTPLATSTSTLTPIATETATATPQPTATRTPAPVGGILDNFNRPGPALGANWVGDGSEIISNTVRGKLNESVYWTRAFGANQWASVRVVRVEGCTGFGLLLKAANSSALTGLVDVRYVGCGGQPQLRIYSFNARSGFHSPFNGANIVLKTGDVLSAAATSNRIVAVYVNGAFLVSDTLRSENAGFDAGRAGQIGLYLTSPSVILDDFDGGDIGAVSATATPQPTAISTPTATSTTAPEPLAGASFWQLETWCFNLIQCAGTIEFERGIDGPALASPVYADERAVRGLYKTIRGSVSVSGCSGAQIRVVSSAQAAGILDAQISPGQPITFEGEISGARSIGIVVTWGDASCAVRFEQVRVFND